MRFVHEGKTYALEFQRTHRDIRRYQKVKGKTKAIETVSTRYPYTTVNLLELGPEDPKTGKPTSTIYRTGTVGCWFRDRFSLEDGRLAAMRFMVRADGVSREMRIKVFDCYFGRHLEPVEQDQEEKVTIH